MTGLPNCQKLNQLEVQLLVGQQGRQAIHKWCILIFVLAIFPALYAINRYVFEVGSLVEVKGVVIITRFLISTICLSNHAFIS